MKAILRIPADIAPLEPLSPEREQRPIGVTCANCGLDGRAVADAAIALYITHDPICCEIPAAEPTE